MAAFSNGPYASTIFLAWLGKNSVWQWLQCSFTVPRLTMSSVAWYQPSQEPHCTHDVLPRFSPEGEWLRRRMMWSSVMITAPASF